MITGTVGADLVATITLELRGDAPQAAKVGATVDTGYNGFITLPLDILQRINAEFYDESSATLADGSDIITNLYVVRIVWDGAEKIVIAEETAGGSLVGMELMLDYVVTVEAWCGGQVTITSR